MELWIDEDAGRITRVMIHFERSGRFVTIFRRRPKYGGYVHFTDELLTDKNSFRGHRMTEREAFLMECQREAQMTKLMEEYLREEIENGIKAHEEERRGIPKGYRVNFPGHKKSRPADQKEGYES